MNRDTIFSPCRKYRYTLWREWSDLTQPDAGYAQFICLNPSTADEINNDPTVTRCINFSKAFGCTAFVMTNLFAWRDTKPENMKAASDPVGPDNDRWLLEIASGAKIIVCGWGKHGSHKNRGEEVLRLLQLFSEKLFCLKQNLDGSPMHPLYIASNTAPIGFNHKHEARIIAGGKQF